MSERTETISDNWSELQIHKLDSYMEFSRKELDEGKWLTDWAKSVVDESLIACIDPSKLKGKT